MSAAARFLAQVLGELIVRPIAVVCARVLKRAANAVPKREKFAVVDSELEMVVCVVGTAVDVRSKHLGHSVKLVVDGDGPKVDKHKKPKVQPLVQRKQKGVDVVGQALHEPVNRVKGVAGKRRWHFPLVVELVEWSVEDGKVEPPVNPVDTAIGKQQKRHGRHDPKRSAALADVVVKLGVATDLGHEQKGRGQRHPGDRGERRLDLEPFLVWNPFGMLFEVVVKEKEIAEGSRGQVHEHAADHGNEIQRNKLTPHVVLCPRLWVHVRREDMLVHKIKHNIHGCHRSNKQRQPMSRGCSRNTEPTH
eukprot:m.22776 g.22776  ORF g.22776 m.22776 type:complete len:305 (+) comp6947_c0_seq1:178-1092(+)